RSLYLPFTRGGKPVRNVSECVRTAVWAPGLTDECPRASSGAVGAWVVLGKLLAGSAEHRGHRGGGDGQHGADLHVRLVREHLEAVGDLSPSRGDDGRDRCRPGIVEHVQEEARDRDLAALLPLRSDGTGALDGEGA